MPLLQVVLLLSPHRVFGYDPQASLCVLSATVYEIPFLACTGWIKTTFSDSKPVLESKKVDLQSLMQPTLLLQPFYSRVSVAHPGVLVHNPSTLVWVIRVWPMLLAPGHWCGSGWCAGLHRCQSLFPNAFTVLYWGHHLLQVESFSCNAGIGQKIVMG